MDTHGSFLEVGATRRLPAGTEDGNVVQLSPRAEAGKLNHIALLTHLVGGGGLARVLFNLGRAWLDAGFRVDLVLLEGRNSRLEDVPAGVRVIDLATSRRAFRGLPAVARYMRTERPDAMLSAVYPRNLLALWARAVARVPTRIVVSEHTMLSTGSNERRSKTRVLSPQLIRFTYRLADGIVAVSNGVADDLGRWASLPRQRITIIPNPVVWPRLQELAAAPVEHPWFGTGDVPVILSAGRLSAEKDFPTLIRAFACVRRTREARLVILGDGRERPGLEKLVSELGLESEASLPGFVQNPYAFMARASVFALSSVQEGFGNVLVEALACGCPVVATTCPEGPAEILENGRYGRLVPVGDAESMACSIVQTFDEPPDRARLRARGQEFTVERSATKYLELLGFHDAAHADTAQGRRASDARPDHGAGRQAG